MKERLRKFLFPELNRVFWIRLAVVAGVAYVLFGRICIPTRIHGASMEPTFADGSVNFCWCPRYAFSAPAVGDVVVVRLAGTRVMLLKRVVAVAGDTVEFRNGRLLVNDRERNEPYVANPCTWTWPPKEVKPGHIYVVGDNRSMPIDAHRFGQTALNRVVGGPLW